MGEWKDCGRRGSLYEQQRRARVKFRVIRSMMLPGARQWLVLQVPRAHFGTATLPSILRVK